MKQHRSALLEHGIMFVALAKWCGVSPSSGGSTAFIKKSNLRSGKPISSGYLFFRRVEDKATQETKNVEDPKWRWAHCFNQILTICLQLGDVEAPVALGNVVR